MIKLTAAYGRKYFSKESALKDWEEGKDFKIVGGPYTSIRDQAMLKDQFNEVYIVYFDLVGNVTIRKEVQVL